MHPRFDGGRAAAFDRLKGKLDRKEAALRRANTAGPKAAEQQSTGKVGEKEMAVNKESPEVKGLQARLPKAFAVLA